MPLIETPEDFLCPINKELMDEPTTTTTGQTYDWKSIHQWFFVSNQNTDPMTGITIPQKLLVPNVFAKKQIQTWLEKNRICTHTEFLNSIQFDNVEDIKKLNYLEKHLVYSHPTDGKTPLHITSLNKRYGDCVTKFLLSEYGDIIDINATDHSGGTPLHFAIRCNRIDIALVLLSFPKTQVDPEDLFHHTPLHLAACNNFVESLNLLVASNANIFAVDKSGFTPLHLSVSNNCYDTTKRLIEVMKETAVTLSTPKSHMNRKKKTELQQLVKKGGSILDVPDSKGRTALHIACSYKFLDDIMKLLLDSGANPSAKTKEGMTPLHFAARANKCDAIRYLLALNSREETSETPRHYINVDEPNREGQTPLQLAIMSESNDAAKILLWEYGADPRITDNNNMTALHYAVRSNNESIVRLLLFGAGSDKRVSLETKTVEGYTVLHLAALHNCKSIARLLIRAGSDLSARTNEGESAVHLASSKGHIKLSTFLFDALNSSFHQGSSVQTDTVLESKSIDSVERRALSADERSKKHKRLSLVLSKINSAFKKQGSR